MQLIRQRLRGADFDGGMSLVEVVVALLVFAIVATGVASGTTTITRLTTENRARQVATNLAAKDLDAARAIGDPLKVHPIPEPPSTTVPATRVGNRDFFVTRATSKVTVAGADTTCGTNQNFNYLRVTSSVTWTGRLSTTQPVVSSTVLAPSKPINDAGTGAISAKVTDKDGQPQSGVTVRVTPVTDGRALGSQPDDTDGEGCSYAARVVPGTYKIVLSHAGYIDTTQQEQPTTTTAAVAAGSTYPLTAQYDDWATFTTNYAGNFTTATPMLPTNLETTFAPNETAYPIASKTPTASSVHLYPFGTGYTAVAGTFAKADRFSTCASVDPRAWPAGTVGTARMAQGVRAAATALTGKTATFGTATTPASIPMGVVKVTALPGTYVTAKTAPAAGVGNPGCTTDVSYTFDKIGATGTAYIALPWGSWSIYQGTAVGQLSLQLPALNLSVPTNKNLNGVTSILGLATVTLDPRELAP